MCIKYSLCIIFLHLCFQEGMILAGVRRFIARYILVVPWMRKPVYDCLVCMAGMWTVILWFLDGNTISTDLLWCIAKVGGMNAIATPFVEGAIFEILKKHTHE